MDNHAFPLVIGKIISKIINSWSSFYQLFSSTVTPKLADKKANGFAHQRKNNEQGGVSLFLNQEIS